LTAKQFAKAMREYEQMSDLLGKMGSYAYLLWSTNTEDPANGKLLQQITEFSSEISQLLVFFDVDYLAIPDATIEQWLATGDLEAWNFYLQSTRRFRPHILSESEEQILTQKSVTGAQAWIRYFDETLGAARFTLDGEELAEQDVLSKLHEADRELRRRAAASLTEGFSQMRRTLTYIFNTLLADKQINDRLRKYPSWISSRNLSNLISDETVDILVDSVQQFYPVVQRYYRLKKRILGVDALMDYDRYAPILESEAEMSWDDASQMSFSRRNGLMRR